MSYDWPGNVRELEHVIEQALVTTPGAVIEPENLPSQIVTRHDEPFGLDFDHRRPLPEITNELTSRIERAVSQERPREIPRSRRALRQALRAFAAQHQRKTPPVSDRQARVQDRDGKAPAARAGVVEVAASRVDTGQHTPTTCLNSARVSQTMLVTTRVLERALILWAFRHGASGCLILAWPP